MFVYCAVVINNTMNVIREQKRRTYYINIHIGTYDENMNIM